MQLHDCTLLDVASARGSMELINGLPCASTVPKDECSATKSSANMDRSVWAASDSAAEKPVASGWLSGWHRWIWVRWRRDRWFFTSLFLTRLMAAPVVRLRAWKMLVWSVAWNAEGEKGNTASYLEHTPARACVPADSSFISNRKYDCLHLYCVVKYLSRC